MSKRSDLDVSANVSPLAAVHVIVRLHVHHKLCCFANVARKARKLPVSRDPTLESH